MKDKSNNLIFAVISILLIIIIVSLVYYKNKTDKHLDKNYYNNKGAISTESLIIENFLTEEDIADQQQIISNNELLNNYISKINNASIILNNDTNLLTENITNNISSNIGPIVQNISDKYNTSNIGINNNISNLEDNLADLENMIYNMNLQKIKTKEYSRIKSLNNGMDMELIKTPNTYFRNLNTGSNTAAYMLMMNKGCLSVGANDYDVYKCNDKNPKQYFKIQNILNKTDYIKNIDKALPSGTFDLTNVNYPFAMIKSVNNENCLTNNHGEITVQPCYSFVAQRWTPL